MSQCMQHCDYHLVTQTKDGMASVTCFIKTQADHSSQIMDIPEGTIDLEVCTVYRCLTDQVADN